MSETPAEGLERVVVAHAWSVIHTFAPSFPATSPTSPVPLPSSRMVLPCRYSERLLTM